VKGFRVDADGVIVEDDASSASSTSPPDSPLRDLEKQARFRAQNFNVEEQRRAAEQREEAKRRTLEQQARQRAAQKQQLEHEEKRRRLSEQLALQEEKARIAEERARLEEEQKRRAEQQKIEQEQVRQQEQYDAIANTLAQADETFVPSSAALENTKLMLQEIAGPRIDANYVAKEGYTTGRNVQIYSGRTESVPVRVSMPGTFVEFTIDKKSLDFGFEIIAFMDSGEQVVLKSKAPFWQHAGGKRESRYEDRLLIGAGSAPCQLQFRFYNTYSTLLEKVIVSYRIKVTSPPKELVLKGRRNRCDATLKVLEGDTRKNREVMAKRQGEIEFLREEMDKLNRAIMKKTKMVSTIREEERRWDALLQKLKTGGGNGSQAAAKISQAIANDIIDTTATAAPTKVVRPAKESVDPTTPRSAPPQKRTRPKGAVGIRIDKDVRGSGVRNTDGVPKQGMTRGSAKGVRPRKVKRPRPNGTDNVE
jgi:hypothetical protein